MAWNDIDERGVYLHAYVPDIEDRQETRYGRRSVNTKIKRGREERERDERGKLLAFEVQISLKSSQSSGAKRRVRSSSGNEMDEGPTQHCFDRSIQGGFRAGMDGRGGERT